MFVNVALSRPQRDDAITDVTIKEMIQCLLKGTNLRLTGSAYFCISNVFAIFQFLTFLNRANEHFLHNLPFLAFFRTFFLVLLFWDNSVESRIYIFV